MQNKNNNNNNYYYNPYNNNNTKNTNTNNSNEAKDFETISDDISLDSSNLNKPYSFIFKIILIGDSNCGKTSSINRYVKKTFSENYICTIGVDFLMKNLLINNELIKLQIWDTAGMEKYKQITTSYYRGAQAAVICFDLTNKQSFFNVEKWVADFNRNCNSIFKKTICVIGNKADLTEERQVDAKEIDDYVRRNNYAYFECSAKTGSNIDVLFLELAKVLYSHYKNVKDEDVKSSVAIRKSTAISIDEKYLNILYKENKKCVC